MSQEFNPNSLDSTLATIIAEQKANHAAIMARFDGQDTELKAIKTQAQLTNGRVTGLEQREREGKVRVTAYATVFSAIGASLAFIVPYLFKLVFHTA